MKLMILYNSNIEKFIIKKLKILGNSYLYLLNY